MTDARNEAVNLLNAVRDHSALSPQLDLMEQALVAAEARGVEIGRNHAQEFMLGMARKQGAERALLEVSALHIDCPANQDHDQPKSCRLCSFLRDELCDGEDRAEKVGE